MATTNQSFAEEEGMAVDDGLGYPKAYAKLCRTLSVLNPYANGPPFAFLPYTLKPQEALREKDLNQMFPVIDPEALPFVNPRGFVNLLWKQLDHLGNAGFDPSLFRVDPYGNVLYLHADSASPLAWDIDHWFPCSRGGRTVPSNLRLLQWQVCKRKHNKLEFLIPWWDLQLGISVNQFLSIFASKNSDFRSRALSFLFYDGGSEELNTQQAVDAHRFPQHFVNMEREVGLGPAAIVSSVRGTDASVLRPLDANRSIRQHYPLVAAKKITKEDRPHGEATQNCENYDRNPYLSIATARNSLRQREDIKKKKAEIHNLEDELSELKQKNEEDRIALQELEALLIKRRQRVEKCRRLSEAQSSYKVLLEKMIRDAMHQSVVYKEQVRLNKSAASALMARLEAQRAICDSSEKELRRRFKQRDEIEKQIRPAWELRKRSRIDDALLEEGRDGTRGSDAATHKELRIFLEEEQKASEVDQFPRGGEEETEESTATGSSSQDDGLCRVESPQIKHLKNSARRREKMSSRNNEQEQDPPLQVNDKLKQLAISDQFFCSRESKKQRERGNHNRCFTEPSELKLKTQCKEEDEEFYCQIGQRNVDKWLEVLLDGSEGSPQKKPENPDNIAEDSMHPRKIKLLRPKPLEVKTEAVKAPTISRKSFEVKDPRSESSRGFRSLPSSPSMILGMTRRVDCIRRKPQVLDDDDHGNKNIVSTSNNNFIKSCAKVIKKAVNM
ncbi:uncharacterized protein LOC121995726 [Zingiber officinale]|uniref:Trichohyalin n=1 Tax=Zingiber officinale TaxID=94328 RepID=A0A8J5L2B7_ZINOF|nr:uncharacterized protein LOC121995726 [Zingiber officinale]KAG6498746.1 hypothetical protein ZIOFF_038468 [Zingiber officinale]